MRLKHILLDSQVLVLRDRIIMILGQRDRTLILTHWQDLHLLHAGHLTDPQSFHLKPIEIVLMLRLEQLNLSFLHF